MKYRRILGPSLIAGVVAVGCGDDDDSTPTGSGGSAGHPSGGATVGKGGNAGALGGSAGASGGSVAESGGSIGESGGGGGLPAEGGAPSAAGSGNEGGNPSAFDGTCASLPGKIVYIESGDTQESLLKNLGRHLRDEGITLAFNLTGSCTLTNDIYTGAKVVKSGMLKYVPSRVEDPSWTPAAAAPTCTTGPEGVPVDVAISALFVESCGLGGAPVGSGLGLIQGPVQAYTFIVPTASDQTAIWAEEAYYAFGFGAQNPLAPTYNPWNDEASMFIRPATKSTLVATAKNIAVPPNKWKGIQEAASSDVVNAVVNSTKPAAAIGILGAEVYDNNRTKGMKTLAFQAFGQSAAYLPDSTSTSFDKQNVRDGHYTLWSPTVYITTVDSHGVPTDPTVKYVVDQVLGKSAASTFDGLADVVKVGLIPECAMQVSRLEDGGELSPFTPEVSCTCYYLSKVPGATGAPAGCTACADSSACGAGVCSHGFCEPNSLPPTSTTGTGCFTGTPATHAEIINACSTADSIKKNVVLPSSTLEPLP